MPILGVCICFRRSIHGHGWTDHEIRYKGDELHENQVKVWALFPFGLLAYLRFGLVGQEWVRLWGLWPLCEHMGQEP